MSHIIWLLFIIIRNFFIHIFSLLMIIQTLYYCLRYPVLIMFPVYKCHYVRLCWVDHQPCIVCNISCEGQRIQQVDIFKYLGFTITPDAKCDIEIKKRVALSKDTFNKMKSIFTNRNIGINSKVKTMKAYVWSILLYGCDCWTKSNSIQNKSEAIEMWFLWRFLRVSWTEKNI